MAGQVLRVLSLTCLLCACGKEEPAEDDDAGEALVGQYQVTSYALDDAGCDDRQSSDWREPWFEVDILSFLGARILAVYACSGPDDCDEGIFGAAYYFDAFDDDGGSGTVTATWASGGMCGFSWTENTLEATPAGVRVRSETRENGEPVTGDDLDACAALQEVYSGARTCIRSDVLEGERL